MNRIGKHKYAVLIWLFIICQPNVGQINDLTSKSKPWPYEHPYLTLPDSLYKENKFYRAFFYYHQALGLFTEEGNLEGILKCKNMMAIKYQLDNELDSAFSVLMEVVAIAEVKNLTIHPEVAKSHFLLGQTYDFKGELELALKEHMKALEMKKKVFGVQHQEIAISYNGIGEAYLFTKNDYYNAEKYLYLSLDLWEKPGVEVSKELAKTYYNLASANRFNEDYEKALAYASKALQTYSGLPQDHQRYINNCYSLLANIYHEKKDFKNAIELNQRAIEFFEGKSQISAYESFNKANFLKNLGAVYTDLEETGKANYYYQLALDIYSKQSNPLDVSYCYLNMGRNFMLNGATDSAQMFLEKSLKIRKELFGEKHISVSHAYRFLGDLFFMNYHRAGKLDHLDVALEYYQRALSAAHPDFSENDIEKNPPNDNLFADRALFLLWPQR